VANDGGRDYGTTDYDTTRPQDYGTRGRKKGGQERENRKQKAESRGRKTEDGGRKTEAEGGLAGLRTTTLHDHRTTGLQDYETIPKAEG
jgi:hypothetical protein